MRDWAIAISAACLLATGCAKDGPPDAGRLPLSKYACRIIDRSPLEITVRAVGSDNYTVGTLNMNGAELAAMFTNAIAQWGKGIPVAIRAEPEARFGVVWKAVRLAATNGCTPSFDVRVPDVDWPKKLTFLSAESVVVTSNAVPTVSIGCTKDGIRVNARPVTLVQLQGTLQKLASISRDVPVSISAGKDVSHQEIISILDACEGVGIRHGIVGLEKE